MRITHLPTGIVVSMQDEKSQLQNKERGLRVLRARLYERAQAERDAEISATRRSQLGTGERAEKVRTYNYPQNRVTDHRVDVTLPLKEQVLHRSAGRVHRGPAGRGAPPAPRGAGHRLSRGDGPGARTPE